MTQYDTNINFKNTTQGQGKCIFISICDDEATGEGFIKKDVDYDNLDAGQKTTYDNFVQLMQDLANE